MKKVLAAFSVIVMALVLSGCQGGTTRTTPFIGGTNALLISFQEFAPPAEVYDGGQDPFDIAIQFKNEGEYDIPENGVTVILSGIDPRSFGKNPSDMVQTVREAIRGKQKDSEGNIIPGDYVLLEFKNLNYGGTLLGSTTLPLMADVCYKYGGVATTNLCYRKNLRSGSENAVCKVNEPKAIYNSAGPVQVTEFRQFVKGANEIGFTFKIAKLGNGAIFDPGLANCLDARYGDKNLVWVEVLTEDSGLKCWGLNRGTGGTASTDTTKGFVRLADGQAAVTCELPVKDLQSDYEKPISISLTYKYNEGIKTTLTVKHALE